MKRIVKKFLVVLTAIVLMFAVIPVVKATGGLTYGDGTITIVDSGDTKDGLGYDGMLTITVPDHNAVQYEFYLNGTVTTAYKSGTNTITIPISHSEPEITLSVGYRYWAGSIDAYGEIELGEGSPVHWYDDGYSTVIRLTDRTTDSTGYYEIMFVGASQSTLAVQSGSVINWPTFDSSPKEKINSVGDKYYIAQTDWKCYITDFPLAEQEFIKPIHANNNYICIPKSEVVNGVVLEDINPGYTEYDFNYYKFAISESSYGVNDSRWATTPTNWYVTKKWFDSLDKYVYFIYFTEVKLVRDTTVTDYVHLKFLDSAYHKYSSYKYDGGYWAHDKSQLNVNYFHLTHEKTNMANHKIHDSSHDIYNSDGSVYFDSVHDDTYTYIDGVGTKPNSFSGDNANGQYDPPTEDEQSTLPTATAQLGVVFYDGFGSVHYYYSTNVDTVIKTPPPISRIGYTFKGWFINDVLIDDTYTITGDTKVYAKWTNQVTNPDVSVGGGYNILTDVISGVFGNGMVMIFMIGQINFFGVQLIEIFAMLFLGATAIFVYKMWKG